MGMTDETEKDWCIWNTEKKSNNWWDRKRRDPYFGYKFWGPTNGPSVLLVSFKVYPSIKQKSNLHKFEDHKTLPSVNFITSF